MMPRTPTWVNEKRYSNARVNSIMLFLLQSVLVYFLTKEFIDV